MKIFAPFIVLFAGLLIASFTSIKEMMKHNTEQPGFAVVELFTSEGCSSCPSADEALEEIQKNHNSKNVIVLGYHVDYWDRLGWKDVFSNPAFTKRQEYYAGIFSLNSIYTPQAVINGESQFVGSGKSKIEKSIDDKLNVKGTVLMTLNAAQTYPGRVDFNYSLETGSSKNDQLAFLLVQKEATNKIKRGENGGRTLHHINIVRDLLEKDILSKDQQANFQLPAGLKKEDVFIVALVQNKISGKIVGFQSSQIK